MAAAFPPAVIPAKAGTQLITPSREKRIKKWNRAWKIELIARDNPDWLDLWDTINN